MTAFCGKLLFTFGKDVMRLVLILFLLCGFSTLALANSYDSDFSGVLRPGQAIRNLGMGNTGVALSADENALYYNPAGLGGVDSLMLGLSTLVEIPAISELSEYQDSLSNAGSSSLQLTHIRGLLSFSAIVPFGDLFTFGGIFSYENTYDLEATIDNTGEDIDTITNSSIGVGVREDVNTRYGLAVAPGAGKWVLGAQLNYTKRKEQPFTTLSFLDLAGDALTAEDLQNFQDIQTKLEAYNNATTDAEKIAILATFSAADNATVTKVETALSDLETDEILENAQTLLSCYTSNQETTSYSLGVQKRLVSLPSMRMTLGAVAHNVQELNFGQDDNCPRNHQPEYDIGVSAQPRLGPLRLLMALDIKDVGYANPNDTYCRQNKGHPSCFQKRLHYGVELGFLPIDSASNFISVRAGVSQSKPTYGFELNPFVIFRFFTLEYAHYTEEMGQEIGDKPNVRDVIQLRFAF
jgi:hypothetical protein